MGKHLGRRKHSDVPFDNYDSGCMWGVTHFLDNHQWHNVKKILPHRRHGGGRHARCDDGAKPCSKVHIGEVQEFLGAECDCIDKQQSISKTTSNNKRFSKARIKSLIAKQLSKEKEDPHKRQTFHFPVGSRLQRTHSIHHLEPSNNFLAGTAAVWDHPIFLLHNIADDSSPETPDLSPPNMSENPIFCNKECDMCDTIDVVDCLGRNQLSENSSLFPEQCDKAKESSANQKTIDANQLNRDVSRHQFEEYVDCLEVFKVNKKLFLEVLQNPNAGKLNHSNRVQNSKMKPRLTKSGSFPMADLSHTLNLKPGELKHKQTEIWSSVKGENLLTGTQAPKLLASKSLNNLYAKSMSSMGDNTAGNVLKLEVGSSSPVSPIGLSEESRFHNIKRASSLNDSLVRYAQLFERSFERETKLHHSKSLKLTNEDEFPSNDRGPKYFRRIRSLSNANEFHDAPGLGMPIRLGGNNFESDGHAKPEPVSLPKSIEKCLPVSDAVVETQCQENMMEQSDSCPKTEYTSGVTKDINEEGTAIVCELSENMVTSTTGKLSSHAEEDIGFTRNGSIEIAQQSSNSILKTYFEDDVASPAEFQMPGGSELKATIDGLKSSVNIQNRCSTDTLPAAFTRANSPADDNASKTFDNYFPRIELDGKNEAVFNYVKNILEESGNVGNSYMGTWPSLDQPLSLSEFEELEARLATEAELCGEDIGESNDHQLLFDLVNEVLLEMYEKSYSYWPRALSHSCHIRPMPTGHRVLPEVWKSMSRYLSSISEQRPSIDHIIAQDLAKDNGWMNLLSDSERVALELEDIIFDDLLDEIICS